MPEIDFENPYVDLCCFAKIWQFEVEKFDRRLTLSYRAWNLILGFGIGPLCYLELV